MHYRSLRECVNDLERHGQLVRIPQEVDPNLEMAAIHRLVFQAGGPAIFYERVKGSPFPAVSNLYGTMDRCRLLFRDSLDLLKQAFAAKANPMQVLKKPFAHLGLVGLGLNALPKKVNNGPALARQCRIDQLPQIRCWPDDGGGFVLLGQVYTEDRDRPGPMGSNLGMYRIQMSGNEYIPNEEVGMHYQIRRDIGIHHAKAVAAGEPLRVSIFVGGPPAHAFAAVMYLPEGLPEVAFAGALARRRFRYAQRNGFAISAEADFCIVGTVKPGKLKPEGPFGDHLGYYSLAHPFPVLDVEAVYHRADAIWPFTVVGRPPQEDSCFGALVQEIAGPMIPREIPGVKKVHAVDAAGVHPLLLAIGSERYAPYEQQRKPQELLTLANALLGYGPCSLAKYLIIAAGEDDPQLDAHNVAAFFRHVLERVDWREDLHFQTATTIDTLDYSGTALNEGSKVVIAAAGPQRRKLAGRLPADFSLPEDFEAPRFAQPGILAIGSPKFENYPLTARQIKSLADHLKQLPGETLDTIPLIILCDDSKFTAKNLDNFLWVTFTRSNPSHDIHGVGSATRHKHFGCTGPLLIDARLKPHHATPLIEDPKIEKQATALGASGGPLHGII